LIANNAAATSIYGREDNKTKITDSKNSSAMGLPSKLQQLKPILPIGTASRISIVLRLFAYNRVSKI